MPEYDLTQVVTSLSDTRFLGDYARFTWDIDLLSAKLKFYFGKTGCLAWSIMPEYYLTI